MLTTRLADGLYRVVTSYLCAGFVVKDHAVVAVAPILVKRFTYWQSMARRVGP
jgi:hypothetical protein